LFSINCYSFSEFLTNTEVTASYFIEHLWLIKFDASIKTIGNKEKRQILKIKSQILILVICKSETISN